MASGKNTNKNTGAAAAAAAPAAAAATEEAKATAPAPAVEETNTNAAVDASAEGAAAAAAAKPAVAAHPVQLTLESLSEAVKNIRGMLATAETYIKTLTRETKKLCKRRGGSSKPSNLTLPLELSADLTKFLGVEAGSKMTRGQVTRAINQYAIDNKIKHPSNGRVIVLDANLAKLLAMKEKDELEIINVQSHLRDHYIKPAPAAVAVSVTN